MSDPWRIIFRTTGGPEVLERETFDPGFPGPGQVRVKVSASGVNFIDTYHRAGLYPLPLPSGLGTEFAGVVDAVGPDEVTFAAGVPTIWPNWVQSVVPASALSTALAIPKSITFGTGFPSSILTSTLEGLMSR